MTNIFARHRAACGAVSVAAMAAYFGLPSAWPVEDTGFWLARLALGALWFGGLLLLAQSPYWKIVYRESPLRRAATGMTDLDERELALRDRANGLTYYLLLVVTMLLMLAFGAAADAGAFTIDGGMLIEAIIPYAFFAMALPVIVIEWFEPSHLWVAPLDEEEMQ